MSVLEKISYYQGRRDEVPNQELARQLAKNKDAEGIRVIAENLGNRNANIQSDCLKVLYETGYIAPELIAGYAAEFLKLLKSRNNRLVWGGMIALATVAPLAGDTIYPQVEQIIRMMDTGSVITADNAVKVLAALCAGDSTRSQTLFPHLVRHLQTCRPVDVARHAEYIASAVNAENKTAFLEVLDQRLGNLRGSQFTRVKKVINETSHR